MTALDRELPDAILLSISRLRPELQEEYLKDALQETRFSSFISSTFLVLNAGNHPDYLRDLQEKYSRFLVYSAREWFIAIPSIQCIRNPLLEKYLRLTLSELLQRNIIQETEGWNYYLIRTALVLWAISPIVPELGSVESMPLVCPPIPSKGPPCIYCDKDWQCMAKDKTKCHSKKFGCFIEGGVHLCRTHGEIVFGEDRPLGVRVELEDGRVIWGVGKADYIDRYGVQFHDYEKNRVALNEFGEYNVIGCPKLDKDWFMQEPDDLDEVELRVRDKMCKFLPPQSFWDA